MNLVCHGDATGVESRPQPKRPRATRIAGGMDQESDLMAAQNPNGDDRYLIDPEGPMMRAVYTDLVVRILAGFLVDACDRGLTEHEVSQIVEQMCEIHGPDLTHREMRETLDAAVEAKRASLGEA